MSRINIEDSLFNDPRMEILFKKLGRELAVGHFVFIAKLAQRYFVDGESIPKKIWHLGEYPKDFIEVGLVIEKEDGFYLRGSEDHFSWLVAKKENGKKGGRPRENSGLIKANDNLKKANDNLSESYGNPPTPTPTPTPTKEKNTYTSKAKASAGDDDFYDAVVDIWNGVAELCKIPQVTKPINPKRKKHLKQALTQMPDLKDWGIALCQLTTKPFYLGENDRNWKANFDWFIAPTKTPYLTLAEEAKSQQEISDD